MKFTYTYNSITELNNNINNILVGEIDRQYFEKMNVIDKSHFYIAEKKAKYLLFL